MQRIMMCLCILLLMQLSVDSKAQDAVVSDSLKQDLLEAARQIMARSGTCALITIDKEGRPRVRAMDPFLPTEDFVVWFGSNPFSRKIMQIIENPRVSLYYHDSDDSGYVMIHGLAQIIDDSKSKTEWWKEKWTDFYPNHPDDYILIKVEPEWLEVISTESGILGDEKTWTPPIVKFK